MKRTLALALLGLLAVAALVEGQRDGGGGGGDRGNGVGNGNVGDRGNGNGNVGDRGNGNGNGNFDNNNVRNVNVDVNGGYYGSDGRYWWHGGWWSGGCYGCGIWYCYNNCPSNVVSCPSCQWYDSSAQQCISTSACTSGRKLLMAT